MTMGMGGMARLASRMLLTLAVVAALGGCTSPDQVELRLFPCEFEGVEPRAVVVEISGYDAAGDLVETFEESFEDISAATFADGYASVGYRKDPAVVWAQVRLGWFSTPTAGAIDEAEAIAVYTDVGVPAVGEVMVLGAGVTDCSELDTETGEETGGETGGETGTETGEDTGTETDTETGEDTETEGDSGGVPEVGEPCADAFDFVCAPGPMAEAGTPLLCTEDLVLAAVEAGQYSFACEEFCEPGSSAIEFCAGSGSSDYCLCLADDAPACADVTLGCAEDEVLLCAGGSVVSGDCPACFETAEGYFECAG